MTDCIIRLIDNGSGVLFFGSECYFLDKLNSSHLRPRKIGGEDCYDRQRRCALHHKRTAISDGGLIYWRDDHAPNVYERSDDVVLVVAECSVRIDGSMEESA